MVRIFKLNTGQDDHAIIFLDDYINQVGSLYLNYSSESCFGSPTFLYCN